MRQVLLPFYCLFTMRKLRLSCIPCPKSPSGRAWIPGCLADSRLCFYSLSLEKIKHSPDPQPQLTRGRKKPLRLFLGVQPKGSDSPSSYSAGSQRARAWLEAPSQGLFLQSWVGLGQQSSRPGNCSACGEGLLREGRRLPRPTSSGVAPGTHLLLHLPVMVRYLLLHFSTWSRGAQPLALDSSHSWDSVNKSGRRGRGEDR